MTFNALPRREDFFPKLRRGHGSAHDAHYYRVVDREDGQHGELTRFDNPAAIEHPCVDVTCVLNMPASKNQHHDTNANLRDWCQERGYSDKHIKSYGPLFTMLTATGGR